MTDRWTIAIDRDDIRAATLEPFAEPTLADGEIEVSIDSYAMTANNVTYAVFGKPSPLFPPDAAGQAQGYWDFFAERGTPGRLPVWGFATVTQSKTDGIAVGDHFYGYYPMASHTVLTPARVSGHGFLDVTPRRTALPIIYNQYQRVEALGDYRPEHHDLWPIFRPLFLTGWLIADQFEDESDYDAAQILIASASSKTAIGLAHAMGTRSGARPRTVGLTRPGSVAALSATGVYDEVIGYDAISSLDASVASALVDMAGNAKVFGAVHRHFADALTKSIVVGKSHWEAEGGFGGTDRLPGPPREGFFAPARSEKRVADWGGAGFAKAIGGAWLGFMERAPGLARVDARDGGEAALAAYTEVLEGRADPRAGIIVRP
jgi:hypothetical protein